MTNVEKQTITPSRQTTSIAIPKQQFQEFNKVFWQKSVYEFHVINKTVKDNYIIFEVRSMRVNEFLDILENNNIKWSYINYKY